MTGIDSEDASVLDMTANPYSPAAPTFSDLLTERSQSLNWYASHRLGPVATRSAASFQSLQCRFSMGISKR